MGAWWDRTVSLHGGPFGFTPWGKRRTGFQYGSTAQSEGSFVKKEKFHSLFWWWLCRHLNSLIDQTEPNKFLFNLRLPYLLNYLLHYLFFFFNCNCWLKSLLFKGCIVINLKYPFWICEKVCKHIAMQLKWKEKEKRQWIQTLYIKPNLT